MDFKITIVYPGGFIRVHHRRTVWDLETLQVIWLVCFVQLYSKQPYPLNIFDIRESAQGLTTLASYPGLLTAVFVACSTSTVEGLVKVIMCSDVPGGHVEEWHLVSFCTTLGWFSEPVKCHQDCPVLTTHLLRGQWLQSVVHVYLLVDYLRMYSPRLLNVNCSCLWLRLVRTHFQFFRECATPLQVSPVMLLHVATFTSFLCVRLD